MPKVTGLIKRNPDRKPNGKPNGKQTENKATRAIKTPPSSIVDRWNDAARAFGGLRLSGDQLRAFAAIEGSEDEPWDVMLQTLALDESSALKLLAERTGLGFLAEPKLNESSSRFYELVAQDDARSSSVACYEHTDGAIRHRDESPAATKRTEHARRHA